MSIAKKAVPDGYHTITPQLTLDDAARAIEWYKKALGAEELGRSAGPDGKIMHAELKIGDSRIMVNDPVMDNKGPKAFGGSPASLWLLSRTATRFSNAPSGPAPRSAWRSAISSGAIGWARSSIRMDTAGPSPHGRKI